MFENLKAFIEQGEPLELDASGQPSDREEHVAVLAILLEMAHISPGLSSMELSSIVDSLYRAFQLRGEESGTLLQMVEFLRRERNRLKEFLDTLNKTFNDTQREHVLMLVWKVLLADQMVEKEELEFAAQLRKQLKLSLEQALRAQQRAHSEWSRKFSGDKNSSREE